MVVNHGGVAVQMILAVKQWVDNCHQCVKYRHAIVINDSCSTCETVLSIGIRYG